MVTTIDKDQKEFTVRFSMPDYVQQVARILLKEGYRAYLVGGATRDVVMNITPDDYDIATDAKPEEILSIFSESIAIGMKFGTIFVIVKDRFGESHEVQITTFRSEADYVDGRWPSTVKFVNDIDKDLGRRDFTFNSMALDFSQSALDGDESILEWAIYDPFDGLADLTVNKVVRAVGNPLERFTEDGLRAMRACRIASQLGFDIEDETFSAIRYSLGIVSKVSAERVREEINKMLLHSVKPSLGIEHMRRSGLLGIFIPELLEGYGNEQKLFHSDDVYYHNLKCVDIAPDKIKLAALLHDIGKPRADMGNGHFYGHDIIGAEMSKDIMKRLRYSNAEIEKVYTLIKNHMFFYPYATEDDSKSWTDSAIRRFIARVGEDNIEDLFALRIADATSNKKTAFQPEEIFALQRRISEVKSKDMALKVSDLDISGHDLAEIGIPMDKRMGTIMNMMLEEVIDDPLKNSREYLLGRAKELYSGMN